MADLKYDSANVKDYFAHGSGNAGGVLVGKRHSEGGIKAINKSTGQPLEMEGGEIVITRKAVSDNKKREFQGEMLTNREILSRINESGGGVKIFSEGGDIESHTCSCSGNSYKYGGKMMSDYEIAHHLSKYSDSDDISTLSHKSYEVGGVLNINKLNPTEMFILHKLDNNLHSKCDIHRNKIDDLHHLEKLGIVYTTQTGKHDCYHVRLTDYGMEVLENTDIPVGHFAKGGSTADCGCNHKYDLGGGVDVLPPVIFDKTSVEEGKKIYSEIVNKVGGNKMFSIEQFSDKDKYYANDEKTFEIIDEIWRKKTNAEPPTQFKYFKGINAKYKNQFEINKAIEELVDSVPAEKITPEEKAFIGYYSGYGGLEKYGATGKSIMYEFFTPTDIARKMWGLAYKFGFKGGHVLEPACGIGEFIKYAPEPNMVTGYDINEYIVKICKILHPDSNIQLKDFASLFVKNNNTIKDKVQGLKKYQLIIGNPPYGTFEGKYKGLGEDKYTNAYNFIDYFIFRGLDLLEKDGLLIYIIGTEVAIGGTPFLQQPINKIKRAIVEKGELLDAYRLPNGVFERTDVVSDIVIFRKK